MEDAIRKAHVLIEALPYIRSFRDKIVVIKLGGSVMDDAPALDHLLEDVVFMSAVGMKPVLVHGGGPAISEAMTRQGLKPRFVRGHRVTDEATLAIVIEVLGNVINADIARRLEKAGGAAARLCDGRTGGMRARRKLMEERGPDGKLEHIDLGLVGELISVDRRFFRKLCKEDKIPVVAPLACDADGQVLNVNADQVASVIAAALKAEKIVYLSDTHGIRLDPSRPNSFAPTLSREEVNRLIEQKVIVGGMLPKVEACLEALDRGVHKAHIIDGRIPHSLLLEIFTDEGIGTQLTR